MHLLRQAADVVMALNDVGGIAADRDALDDVRVKRALREEAVFVAVIASGAIFLEQLLGGLLEDVDEFVANDLPLLLGIGDALQLGEEPLGGVDILQLDLEVLAEDALHHLL